MDGLPFHAKRHSIFPFRFAKAPAKRVPIKAGEALFPPACCWMDRRTIPSAYVTSRRRSKTRKSWSREVSFPLMVEGW